MTSLFNLIEDPCKSMWNSSVKLLLGFLPKQTASIFKLKFSNFQISSRSSSFWSVTDQFLTATMAQAMIQGMVKVLGNPSTWIHPLPDNHGK